MKLKSRTTKRARIEIIPMIDVIFFLLVFFMVSSLAMSKSTAFKVDLPKVSEQADATPQRITLTLQKDGAIFVNQSAATLETIGSLLSYEMRNTPQEVVIVHADQGVPYGKVMQAMDQARKIGVRKFALATEDEEGRSQQ